MKNETRNRIQYLTSNVCRILLDLIVGHLKRHTILSMRFSNRKLDNCNARVVISTGSDIAVRRVDLCTGDVDQRRMPKRNCVVGSDHGGQITEAVERRLDGDVADKLDPG